MSTRSSITLKLPKDGKYKTVYCHYDGNLEDVGKNLYNHYQSYRKVNNLLNMGDISSLSVDLDTSKFYNRDLYENGVDAVVTDTFEDTEKQEYNYLFDDGHWYVQSSDLNWEKDKLVPLKMFKEVLYDVDYGTKKTKPLKEYTCINSKGIEDKFTEGENYVLSQGNADREMLSLYDNLGIVRECFKERFELIEDMVVVSKNDNGYNVEPVETKCDKCGLFGVDKDSSDKICPYAKEINGVQEICNCCDECRYQCAMDV